MNDMLLAICFIPSVWIFPILVALIMSKGDYIYLKGAKFSTKYAKFFIIVWTIGMVFLFLRFK